jgi:hypothetical protein
VRLLLHVEDVFPKDVISDDDPLLITLNIIIMCIVIVDKVVRLNIMDESSCDDIITSF